LRFSHQSEARYWCFWSFYWVKMTYPPDLLLVQGVLGVHKVGDEDGESELLVVTRCSKMFRTGFNQISMISDPHRRGQVS
jgi:hypothetical protein